MSFEMFLDLTPIEFFEALWEKEKHEEDIVMAYVRPLCESIRMSTFHLCNLQLKRKINDPKKLMKFNWENSTPAQTREEMKKTMKQIAKAFAKKPVNNNARKERKRISRVS